MKFLAFFLLVISSLFALPEEFDKEKYDSGEKLFDNKCSTCHAKFLDMQLLLKNFIEEDNKLLNLKAPTGNQISFRLKQQIGSSDDVEFHIEEITDFMKDYLHNPDKNKTVCLKGVIRHFDTMPSMKDKIDEDEIEDVAFFLYFLEGFNEVNKYYKKDDEF